MMENRGTLDSAGILPPAGQTASGLSFWSALLGALIVAGLAVAGLMLGIGITGLAGDTKEFWYLSRSAGFVAYLLLWGSVVWGLLLSTKIGRSRLKAPAIFDVHRFLSNTALGFAFFHALVLVGDRYLSLPLNGILVPFASSYRTALVAAGQIALWLSLLLSLSFGARKWIGRRAWRTFHYAVFLAYAASLVHSVTLGSDTHLFAVRVMYLFTAEVVLFLVGYRIFARSRRGAPLSDR
jgi:predicted ferric reductase